MNKWQAPAWVRLCLTAATFALLNLPLAGRAEEQPAVPEQPAGALDAGEPAAAPDDPVAATPDDNAPQLDLPPAVSDARPPAVSDALTPAIAPRAADAAAGPTDLWARVRAGFRMPDLEGPLVENRAAWYASRPDLLKQLLERSRRYLFHIVEELENRGMPTELALLPMVESAFNPLAYSRAHASGLWQFIPATGKTYNLSQNWWFDARRDIVASTTAALDYLQTIYEMHGHWHLALASYNWGENAVARAVERNQRLGLPTDFASLAMPAETRWYVPKLQALKNIIANPAAYGLELDPMPNAPYFATVTLTRDIDLQVAAQLAEVSVEELVALNPGHNRPVVASAQSATLVLPADRLDRFAANFANHDAPLSNWRTYAAQRGERIEAIAAAHGISTDRLRQVNSIRGVGRLQESAQLLVPDNRHAHVEVLPPLGVAPVSIAAEIPRVVRSPVRRVVARERGPVRLSSPIRLATYPPTPAARAKAPAPNKYSAAAGRPGAARGASAAPRGTPSAIRPAARTRG